MKTKIFTLFFMLSLVGFSQIVFKPGAKASIQINSAILPDLERNRSLESVLNGDDVVKGVPQLADLKIGYRLGFTGEAQGKIGFIALATEYVSTHIYKEVTYDTGFFGSYSVTALDKKYTYIDISTSFNLFLTREPKLYLGVGAGLDFLTSYSGDKKPESTNTVAFVNLGLKLNEKIAVETKGVLSLNEIYKDSYIHHLMFPIGVTMYF
jgi:hypothetical protein